MRRASGPRLRRRAETHRPALLHELAGSSLYYARQILNLSAGKRPLEKAAGFRSLLLHVRQQVFEVVDSYPVDFSRHGEVDLRVSFNHTNYSHFYRFIADVGVEGNSVFPRLRHSGAIDFSLDVRLPVGSRFRRRMKGVLCFAHPIAVLVE